MKQVSLPAILALLLIILSFRCDKGIGGLDFRMVVKNKSAKDIYYIFSTQYPDTLIPGYPPQPDPTKDPAHKEISPGSDIPIYLRDSWEHIVSTIPEEKLIFFFFDAEILENNNWDSVRKYNMFLEQKILSLDSIRKLDWTVVYP